MLKSSLIVAAVLVALPLAAGATSHSHSGHGADTPNDAAVEGYQAANDRMHESMMIEFTGDADRDFAMSMIGHHQGAIDMARVVLEHGSDPAIRKLAEGVIAAQESEIAFLRDWLAAKGY